MTPAHGHKEIRKRLPDTRAMDPAAQSSELTPDELKTAVGGRDPASGLPTGKRQHKPFAITAET